MQATRHYGGAVRRLADGGLVSRIKGVFTTATTDRKPDEIPLGSGAAGQAKSALTTRKQVLDEAERKAVGMAKGGHIRGKGTGTSDQIPIMASDGEFMIKAAAVKKIGVPALEALNAIADGGKKAPLKTNARGAVRKMRDGGLVVYDQDKAYKPNFTMGGRVEYPEYQRLGVNPPGTSVGPAQYRPNFTMGSNGPAPKFVDPVTDVRAKFNPATASPEAKAYLADRAANPGPQPAGARPADPAATPSVTSRPTPAGKGYGIGKFIGGAVRKLAPASIGIGVVSSFNDYKINDPEVDSSASGTFDAIRRGDFAGAGRSLYKGARETGMDLGSAVANVADAFVPGNAPVSGAYYRFLRQQFGDQLAPAPGVGSQPALPTPSARQAPAVPTPTAAPATAPVVSSPGPAVPSGAVRRVGNSYSGENVAGDITVNGRAPRGGFVGGTGDGTFRFGGPSGNDAALSAARSAAAARGDVDALKASYAAQGESFGPQADPVEMLINNGRPMTTRKAAAIAQLQQSQAQARGAVADRKLAQDKFDLERDGAKLDNQTKQRLAGLQDVILSDKATPEQRKSALESYRALTGKAETPNRYTVVPGGQAIDPASGQAFTQPARVIDNQTGQFVEQQGQTARGANQAPADGTKVKGKDGKFYVVQNGVPVPL